MTTEKFIFRNVSSKTFWAGVVSIVTAIAGYFTGELQGTVAIQMISTSLIGIFLRNAVGKAVEEGTKK